MKKHSKVGNREGKPAYRTPSDFRQKVCIPCHRVIRSDGSPGGYNRGAGNKIKILRKEKAIKQKKKLCAA